MNNIEIIIALVGIPIVWLLMKKVLKPDDPESRKRNVQVGRFKETNVSKRGIYYFYVAIFILAIVLAIMKWLGNQ